MASKCEMCDESPVPTERFCREHRREMLRKMRADGYLVSIPRDREEEEDAPDEDDGLLTEVTDEDVVDRYTEDGPYQAWLREQNNTTRSTAV
jgi:hypothetical protein